MELEDTVLSSVASLYRAMFASAQGAAALSADTSPSCAEEASPIAKHLVLHGSHTILFLNRSSIFQEEMAEPRADAALVPHPCRTGPAQTPPLTQLLNDGLGLCLELENSVNEERFLPLFSLRSLVVSPV